MPYLILTLLGSPQVELDGVPVEIAAQKALALLAYLASTGVPHRRDALATLFWPDYRQTDARTYLRQALHELTKTVGHIWFDVSRETIGLSGAVPIQSDVHEFRRLVVAGRNDPEALRQAVALYTTDFLAGFSLPDCPEFDQWQLLEAESLRRTAAEAMQELIRWHTGRQEYTAAIELAYRWLALDPYHEPAHRSLMQLYAWTGQQAAALRQYEECKRLLRDALDTLPETQRLHEEIRSKRLLSPPRSPLTQSVRQGEPPAAQSPLVAVPAFLSGQVAPAPTAIPFVARERELEELARALATARLGNGQILFVIGGAGRGKTMLVQEFARRAQQDDSELLVVSGMCNAYTGIGDPYLPFREILMALAGDVETQWTGGLISTEPARRLWEAMPVTLPALVEFAPDLIGPFVPVKPLQARAATFAPSDAEWFQQLRLFTNGDPRMQLEERRLFTQYTEALKAVAAQRPLLLILEDLHWVDAASNSLLSHLSREIEHSRILVVGTYRPDELVMSRKLERHPLAGIVGELKRQHGDIWLDLGTLSPGEERAFVDAYLDMQPNQLGETFRAALFRHTGGHALFTAELLRDMRERGYLYHNVEGYWVAGETVDWSALPAKVGGVIEQRIGRLEEELQEILAAASVEGEVFTAEITARVQQLAEQELVQRLGRELERQHRLVRVESLERVGQQRLSRYRFRHHLFQRYLYGRLTESERAYLHEAVGYAMETLYAGETRLVAVQLAHHFEQAGLAEKAVVYLQQAGEQAHQLSYGRWHCSPLCPPVTH
jgi:DNA-binding SARP family transcriptional activator